MAEGSGGRRIGRIASIIRYDGTRFNGWQIQGKGRTLQGVVEGALATLTRQKIRVTASGRTDTGVHALGQVIHFDAESSFTLQKLCIGLNGILPFDISVINAFYVPQSFHARFSAVEREYRYYIYNHPLRSPFMRYRAMWVHEHIDIEYLRRTTGFLVGEHDFASFCKKREANDKNTVRKISRIEVMKKNDHLEIIVVGNSFLHHMVRNIVGTVLDMHKSGADPSSIMDILERKDREFAGITAPPYGLYLFRVSYDPPLEEMGAAYPAV